MCWRILARLSQGSSFSLLPSPDEPAVEIISRSYGVASWAWLRLAMNNSMIAIRL